MKKYILIITVILPLFYSCDKRLSYHKLGPEASFIAALISDTPNLYNYVLIDYKRIQTPEDSGFNVNAYAAFTDSTTGALNTVHSLTINSTTPVDSNNAYTLNYSTTAGKALAGASASVRLAGSSATDTLNSSIYVASDLGRSLSGLPTNGKAKFNKPFTLTWTPDSHSSSLSVIVQLYYYAGLSQSADSALPATMNTLSYMVQDNGSFTFPSADVDTIPQNAYMGISIGRVYQTQGLLPVSNRRVFLVGLSEVTSSPLLVDSL